MLKMFKLLTIFVRNYIDPAIIYNKMYFIMAIYKVLKVNYQRKEK